MRAHTHIELLPLQIKSKHPASARAIGGDEQAAVISFPEHVEYATAASTGGKDGPDQAIEQPEVRKFYGGPR